jgi:hypothetical protein
LIVATVAGHLTAILALLMWSAPIQIVVLLALAVGFCLTGVLRRPWPVRLRLVGDGVWEVRCSDGQIARGGISRGRVLARVISLTVGGPARRTLLLMPDALCDGDHSRLRAWLRHRRGGASC